MAPHARLKSAEAYTVGLIAALPHERAAATAMLDKEHYPPESFMKNAADQNTYSWGRIGHHNIVIASLPSGRYGVTAAAITAHSLSSSLPHVHIGLLVGIGAGIPGEEVHKRTGKLKTKRDIRLGDVVVGNPDGSNGGVVQHDLVKAKGTGAKPLREPKGFLNCPPDVLLNALGAMRSRHDMEESRIPEILAESLKRFPKMKGSYDCPTNIASGAELDGEQDSEPEVFEDRLFRATYAHVDGGDCRDCEPEQEIKRKARPSTIPMIHYGTIASGNTLMKNALERDELVQQLKEGSIDAICLEMEAAGLMNTFPCLVIRGICDYGDSHKNDRWQKYAALTAAAFAKEFLSFVDSKEVEESPKVGELLNSSK